MFESRPSLYFLASFCSWALVSRKGSQRCTESGRKPEREGSSGQSSRLAIERRPPQHLGVQLVGAALDFALDLVEHRDQHVRSSSTPSLAASLANASPMPIPKNVTFVTFDVYGTLIDWETGHLRRLRRGGAT